MRSAVQCSFLRLFARSAASYHRAPPGGRQHGLCDTETTARSIRANKTPATSPNSSCPLPTFSFPPAHFLSSLFWIDYNDFLPFTRITNRHAPWSSPLTFKTSSRRGTLQHPGPRAQSRNHPRSSKPVPIPNLLRLIRHPISRTTNNYPHDHTPPTRRRVRQGSARRHLLLKMRKSHSRENMGPTMSRTQRTNLRPGEKSTRLH